MALGFNHDNPNTVIAAFVCTSIVVIITTMFLSCFRKKKGDKKKKEGKKNAPTSTPPAPVAAATVDTKPSVTVENNSKDGNAIDDSKKSEEPKSCQDTNDALGDFSAVRETEILRSYRKPPPPQNRARQSRAPRALKSSAENLDLFSEHTNDDVFEFNEDATIKPSGTVVNEPKQDKDNDKTNAVNKDIEDDGRVKMRGSSQGRSSMLDDINNTLASFHLEESSAPAEVTASVEEKAQEVKEGLTTNITTTLNAQVEEEVKTVNEEMKEEVKTVNEEMKEEVSSNLQSAVVESQQLEKAAVDGNASVISTAIDEVEEIKEDNDFEGEIEKQEHEIEEKAGGLKTALEEKSPEIVNEIKDHLVNGIETIKDEVDVEQITCEVKETVESKVKETFGGIAMSDSSPKDDTTLPNCHVEEVIVEKSLNELEESPKKEVKIPPKVSPKPSPKIKPKSLFQNSPLTETTSASPNTEPSPPETNEEETNNDEKTVEKVDSPPATPTSPTSPTSKGQSRIPMSKKTSGIPKLAFNSSKSSSASPLASPDSAAKRLEQAEEIANKVQNEVDKAEAGNDLKTNHDTPATPTSEQPESEMSSSTTSPFNEDNRGSKRKLTKLRYSGRKKSSESKSDESGSDRGSRAGSEAKSDDGKKTAEDNEVDKNSRIPVRGGSKPRSSPPKALGNQ